MTQEYFTPAEIWQHLSREQCLWCFLHWDILGEGRWPPDPRETGYTDAGIRRSHTSSHAPFEKAAEVHAELDWRLQWTKRDGQTLLEEINNGLVKYYELSSVARLALDYCTGRRRRRETYWHWCHKKRQRKGVK